MRTITLSIIISIISFFILFYSCKDDGLHDCPPCNNKTIITGYAFSLKNGDSINDYISRDTIGGFEPSFFSLNYALNHTSTIDTLDSVSYSKLVVFLKCQMQVLEKKTFCYSTIDIITNTNKIEITANQDFDESHKKGELLNDLFKVIFQNMSNVMWESMNSPLSIDELISNYPVYDKMAYCFYLSQPPQENKLISFQIKIYQNTGSIFTINTGSIYLTN